MLWTLSRGRDHGEETVETIAGLSIAFTVQMIMALEIFLGTGSALSSHMPLEQEIEKAKNSWKCFILNLIVSVMLILLFI